MTNPIDAERISVEERKIPPCDLWAGARFVNGAWEYTEVGTEKEARDSLVGCYGQTRLFRLRDAPAPSPAPSLPAAVVAARKEFDAWLENPHGHIRFYIEAERLASDAALLKAKAAFNDRVHIIEMQLDDKAALTEDAAKWKAEAERMRGWAGYLFRFIEDIGTDAMEEVRQRARAAGIVPGEEPK